MLIFEQAFRRVYHSLGFSPESFVAGRTCIPPSLGNWAGERGTKIPLVYGEGRVVAQPGPSPAAAPLGSPFLGRARSDRGGSCTKHHPLVDKYLYLGVNYPLDRVIWAVVQHFSISACLRAANKTSVRMHFAVGRAEVTWEPQNQWPLPRGAGFPGKSGAVLWPLGNVT